MPRLATSVALAAWIGFLAVFSARLAIDGLSPQTLAALASAEWPRWLAVLFDGSFERFSALGAQIEILVAAICGATAGVLATALWLIVSPARRDKRTADALAFGAFGAIACLVLVSHAASTPLLPVDLESGSVWLALLSSLLAIGFDRLVAIEEGGAEDDDFEAGIAAIADGLARQTRLYTPSGARTRETRR